MSIFQDVRKGLIPARLTVAEVYVLQEAGIISEDEHFELIEGEIVPMAAAKFSHHEWMKSRLIEPLVLAKPKDTALYVEPSVTLSEDTFVEPDLAIWHREGESQKVRGPDLLLVVEVAASSIGYDLRVKSGLYAQYGVRDYWVVDALRKTIRVHRDPNNGSYRNVEEYAAQETVKALLLAGVSIRLDALD
jgi:Uma2 family endonuclease